MGYIDQNLIYSSVEAAKCRIPSYVMAYIQDQDNGVDCEGSYKSLRSIMYMIKILECVQPVSEQSVNNSPCPPCPDFEYTEFILRAEANRSAANGYDPPDWTDIYVDINMFDTTGSVVGGTGNGPFDLTDPLGISALESYIKSSIDSEYGVTSSGTLSLNGDILTIDITAPISSTPPIPVYTVCFFDESTLGTAFSIASIPV